MSVDPKQIALYERDQRVNERPENGVNTYRSTKPGLPEDHEREHAEAWTEAMAAAATLGAALARMENALDKIRTSEPKRG